MVPNNQLVNVEKAYQNFLEHVYQDMMFDDAYTRQDLKGLQEQMICHGYGELLPPSVITMLKRLNLSEQDTLVDLGSGMGKLAFMAYFRTPAKVIGVEASERLLGQCKRIYQWITSESFGLEKDRHLLQFYHQNFLDYDFNQATTIYSCSTCFTQELLWLIAEKINRAPSIRQVISLKPLDGLTRLSFDGVFSVECSWDSALAYHYRLC